MQGRGDEVSLPEVGAKGLGCLLLVFSSSSADLVVLHTAFLQTALQTAVLSPSTKMA